MADSDGEHVDYVVMGIYNKHYNMWFLMEQDDKCKLKEAQQKSGGVCLHVRKVLFDPIVDLYELVEGDGTERYTNKFKLKMFFR